MQGLGFFKMNEAAITKAHEEIAKDLYERIARHREEIAKLMDDYDDHHMAITCSWMVMNDSIADRQANWAHQMMRTHLLRKQNTKYQ